MELTFFCAYKMTHPINTLACIKITKYKMEIDFYGFGLENDNILIMLDHGYRLAVKGFKIMKKITPYFFFCYELCSVVKFSCKKSFHLKLR